MAWWEDPVQFSIVAVTIALVVIFAYRVLRRWL